MTSTELDVYDAGQLAIPGSTQIMTPEAARELDDRLRQCVRAVLREGPDYGIIPGTGGDKVLFRPGAQRLLQWFSLAYTCEQTDLERDSEGRKHGVTYRAVVSKRGTGEIIATCDGTADYDESKFFKSAEQVQREAEAKERGWAKKDGRVANPTKWQNLPEYRAPWNTLVKRAQKRAIVGATIDATAAGGIFADDEDSLDTPADGGPSWYQQALGEASVVATKDEANQLWADSVQAKRFGAITRDQADHIQNRLRQRVAQLEAHTQVDVEDITPDTPEDASPAQAVPPSAAPADAQGAGEAPKKSGTAGLIVAQFERLGVTDRNDRLILTAQVARLDDIPSSTNSLTAAKQREVLKTLEKCRDLDALHNLLGTGEAQEEARGDA